MQGKLIVLEGIDGSGKSTQFRLLCQRLQREGLDFHRIVFPRYSEDSSSMVRAYLRGNFGERPSDVNAYAASTFFGVDRFASFRLDWGDIYRQGGLILSDRYTTSNAVHQGSKLPEAELDAFFDWLYDFEYRILELPRPDLVLYMDIDLETCLAQMHARERATHTTGDIHETDQAYLARCLRTGIRAAEHYGWQRIRCLDRSTMRPMEDIHGDIYALIKGVL